MNFVILRGNPAELELDSSLVANSAEKDGLIFEHYRYLFSKTLPKVTLPCVCRDGVVVVRRKQYMLDLALQYNYGLVDCVLENVRKGDGQDLGILRQRSFLPVNENSSGVSEVEMFMLFFFDSSIGFSDKERFSDIVVEYVKSASLEYDLGRNVEVKYENGSKSAEFVVKMNVDDHGWQQELLRRMYVFNNGGPKIASFLGRRLPLAICYSSSG